MKICITPLYKKSSVFSSFFVYTQSNINKKRMKSSVRKLFLLFSLSLISFNSFSDKSCEKSLSHPSTLQTITSTIFHATQRATVFPIQRRIIRKRILNKSGEVKPHYRGIIGQSIYASLHHKSMGYSVGNMDNIDATYKSVTRHLTKKEMAELSWTPSRKAQ